MNTKAKDVFEQMQRTVMETGAFKEKAKRLKKKAKKISKSLMKRRINFKQS